MSSKKEKKHTEEQERMHAEQFSVLADDSPDIVVRFDRAYRHIYVNRAILAQTGIPPDKFMYKTLKEMGVFSEEVVEKWTRCLERVFKDGQPHTDAFEVELNGKVKSFEWRNYPEKNDHGEVISVLCVVRDQTDTLRSEVALKQSEERLNLALSSVQLGMWDWNLESGEVYFSPTWFTMLGYRANEWPQEFATWTELQHPDDRESAMNTVEQAIRDRKKRFTVEFRMRNKSGQYRWIQSNGMAVAYDRNGNTLRLTGVHQDVHKAKRDDLIQEVLFDISDAVNSTSSLDELYKHIRESLGRILDTTNCFLALYHEDTDTLTLPFMDDEKDSFTEFPARNTNTSYVIRTGKAQLIDKEREKLLTDSGEIELVGAPCHSWLGVPLKHEGKILGVFAVQSYTTKVTYTDSDVELLLFASEQIALAINRRQKQDSLEQSRESQRRVFEASPDPMLVVDPSARILDFNSAFLEAFNAKPELVYGEKIFRFIHREDWRRSMQDFNKTWEKGFLKNLEYRIVRPDGIIFDAETSSGAIFSSGGKAESMVLIIKNISKRKEAQRSLLEAKTRAEESDRLKTAFLSNMSHEIRTPMNAIVGFADLLTDEGLSLVDRRDFVAQINQGADDLMHLIDDIIDIAKIEAGQVNVHIAECFVSEIFKELQLTFEQTLRRNDKDQVEMQTVWDWPFNELAIYTDPYRLKQVLVNLLGNAVKFTDKGKITLGLEEHPEGIRFYVKDSGIGISKDKLKVIFDRFMQGHDTTTRLYGGTGLGLAISKNLTELLGGKIGVDSVMDQGSTFWLMLPRNEVPLKYEAAIRTQTTDVRNWDRKKILIAEDDHSNFYFLDEALKDTGVQIIWARDGEETLTLFRENKDLSLVLMDINMPIRDGYACTREIKKKRPGLPVVAQTAYAMSGEREIAKEAGCDDYLSKPIKMKDLLEIISRNMK